MVGNNGQHHIEEHDEIDELTYLHMREDNS